MLKSSLKYYIGIILIFIVDSLHTMFFENNDKYDVYLMYDHERYFTNILYDVSNLFTFTVLTYFLSLYNRKIFKPLFVLSLIAWFSYFIFYNQIGNLIMIPVYILMIIIYNTNRWTNNQHSVK